MGYNYTTYVAALKTMMVSTDPDTAFDTILPSIIDFAEQRIYRELDLLSTVVSDASTALTQSTRSATISSSFVAVNSISVLTPAGTTTGNGTRVSLTPVSREVLDILWPGSSVTGVPEMFAMTTQWAIAVGPSPDGAYTLEVIGTQRPAPLSVSNPNTFLTDRLPDLFMAASMIFASGYMRNFGTMSSDPQMGQSWEQEYEKLLASANTEELRKHFWAASWSSRPVSPAAVPQRG